MNVLPADFCVLLPASTLSGSWLIAPTQPDVCPPLPVESERSCVWGGRWSRNMSDGRE